jgi:single-stranded DNA-binding protein
MQMLGSRPENHQHGGNQRPVPQQNQGYAPKPQQQPQPQNYTPDLGEGWDSDIPF